MNTLTIKTNNAERPVLYGWDLTDAERAELDYIDWEAVERGESCPTFARYLGEVYDLGEFSAIVNRPGLPAPMLKWDGCQSDSYFSGVVVKCTDDDCETVVMGRYCS
jgi:hypothetical protein